MNNCSNCVCLLFGKRCKNSNPIPNTRSSHSKYVLALLIDHSMHTTTREPNRRNIHSAAFSISASIEDFDISATRGLERRSILELGQCNWITSRQNMIILGPTGSGKSFLACAFGTAGLEMVSLCVITAPRVCFIRLLKPGKMVHGLSGCDLWLERVC